MPIYEYICAKGHVQETFGRMSERKHSIACERCGKRAMRRISLPVVRGFEPHYDEFLGAHVTSHEQKARVMKEKGFAEKGDTGIRDKRGRIYSAPGVGRRATSAVPYMN